MSASCASLPCLSYLVSRAEPLNHAGDAVEIAVPAPGQPDSVALVDPRDLPVGADTELRSAGHFVHGRPWWWLPANAVSIEGRAWCQLQQPRALGTSRFCRTGFPVPAGRFPWLPFLPEIVRCRPAPREAEPFRIAGALPFLSDVPQRLSCCRGCLGNARSIVNAQGQA